MTIDYQASGTCSRVIECGGKGTGCPGRLARALERGLALKAS